MKPNSRNSLAHPGRRHLRVTRAAHGGVRQSRWLRLAVCCLLSAGLIGCESLERKFSRKPKTYVRPSAIIGFQDYTRAMTPLDRYQKHYVIFDYWNSELIDAFEGRGVSAKRMKRASSESLQELHTLKGLLQDDLAEQLGRTIEERKRLNEQIQRGSYPPSQADLIRRALERQSRDLHRSFSWRKVEDRLNPGPGAPPAEATAEARPVPSDAKPADTTHEAAH